MMTITVRQSRGHEGEHLVRIWCRAVDATHHFLSRGDREEIEVQVRQFLPQAPLWVAADGQDKPVAFMLLAEGHLEALFVDPEWHGKGVGSVLIDYALGLEPGLTTDVNEQNERALGFYRHRGFVVTGRSERDGEGRAYPLLHLAYRGK